MTPKMYTCSMHPEIRQGKPGNCPKCGMALEIAIASAFGVRTDYVCPMHSEVIRQAPGFCPKCGMALEPRNASDEEKENQGLGDMRLRFWVSFTLSLPVFLIVMLHDLMPAFVAGTLSLRQLQWLEFVLATPVVLWGGWPFFQRGWSSVLTCHLNMFTLIALGIGVAWIYSVLATFSQKFSPHRCKMSMAW